ncbi:uncharacterized protein LOC128956881 [Oppia nitens]|uniref:uncharacterized protein LOC128956881 n=1 Tax=Oppia nitens TaxID=1686743 RepID=UPI0023DC2CBE|nr:uncharacterized protein LOC128956881 [Oppia nitens]
MDRQTTPVDDTNDDISSIDPEARQVLMEMVDRVVADNENTNPNNNNTTSTTTIDDDTDMYVYPEVRQLVSEMVDTTVANNSPQQQTVGADNASRRPPYRSPKRRERTKSNESPIDSWYRPVPPPVPEIPESIGPEPDRRSWSVDNLNRLRDQQQQQPRQLAPDTLPSFFDRPPGSGSPPHLFMSALDGYKGKGSGSLERRKGELYQHNADSIESTLSVDDYQQLCQELADYGFINLDNQNIIGQGSRAPVVTGTYGPNIHKNLTTIEAEYLNGNDRLIGVRIGQRFAAKYFHFTETSDQYDRIQFYMEKLIMKQIIGHPNCVTYRMAIGLGQRQLITYRTEQFYSYDHNLLLMDLADQGDLADFIKKSGRYTMVLCIQFMTELLAGLRYLHSLGITHGDIHAGNVLIFTVNNNTNTNTNTNNQVTPVPPAVAAGIPPIPAPTPIPTYVAKWCDFGFSKIRVWAKQEYRTPDEHLEKLKRDLFLLSNLFSLMIAASNTNSPELQPWLQLVDDLTASDTNGNINVIYERYSNLLGD